MTWSKSGGDIESYKTHYPNAFSSLNGLERKVFSLKSTFWGTSVSMVVLFEIIVIRFGAISWKWSVWGPKGPTTTRSEQRKATPIWALFSGGLFNWSKNLFANWTLFYHFIFSRVKTWYIFTIGQNCEVFLAFTAGRFCQESILDTLHGILENH